MIKENQRRAEAAEGLMIRLEQAINSNVCRLGKDIADIDAQLDIIYEEIRAHTLEGRWMSLKRWLGGRGK